MKEKLLMLKDGLVILTAGLSFILMMVLPILHMGFVRSHIHYEYERTQFLSRPSLWMINMGLGILLGLCLNPKNPIISGFSGWIASVAITGSALFYFSFRTSLMSVEMIFPLLPGLLGLRVYDYLIAKKRMNKKEQS